MADPNQSDVRPVWPWVLIVVVIAVVIFGLVYYFATGNNNNTSMVMENAVNNVNALNTPTSIDSNTPTNTSSNILTNVPQSQATVTYTDTGFSPASLTIAKGQTVIFQNASSSPMRVASDPHPTHNGYPTTGGCVGSTFDSCMNILPGASWSFKFDYVGSWGYHNHLTPTQKGTIVVTP